MDFKKLVHERNQIRRVFTRHEPGTCTRVDLEFLEEKINRLSVLDKAIQEELLSAKDFDEDAYTKECDESDIYRRKWLEAKARCRGNIENVDSDIRKHRHSNLNLPKIEIRKFDDNPKSWLAFWGQFKKIHDDDTLDAETKFQYLTQAMAPESKARSLVESYPPTEVNYPKVIMTLKNRFGKDETLIEIYVRELLRLVSCKQEHRSLEILFDKIVTNLQILETLGITMEKYECMLLPMIESTLPEGILLSWAKVPILDGQSKLSNLIKFLQTEVEAERRVELAQTDFFNSSYVKEVVPTAACLLAKTKQVTQKSGTAQAATSEGKEAFCYFCEKHHSTFECSKANMLSLEQKIDAVKKNGGCFICLKRGHLAKNCRAFVKCMCCYRRHFVIFCPTVHDFQTPKNDEQKKVLPEVASNHSSNNMTTVLQTLIVNISGSCQKKKVRALLDSGSQRTYVKAGIAQELGLQEAGRESLSHSLFGGVKKATQTHRVYKFQLSNLDYSYSIEMVGLEQDVLCGALPKVQDASLIQLLQKHRIHLTDADKNVTSIRDIDILIGSDYLGSILEGDCVHVKDNLVAIKTRLGWTLQGPIRISHSLVNEVTSNCVMATPDLSESLDFLWNIETLGIKDPYENSKKITNPCLNITVNSDGRYEVGLLWKDGPLVESNFELAEKRLLSTTKKLENIKYLEGYDAVFKDWEKEGIIEIVHNDNKYEGHYLAHHAVIKLEGTTKIRPVFDASCKDKFNISLNSCINKGLNLIELIPKLLLQFRAGNYGVISDIKKAFLQISVIPEDRKYLKLLWWKDPHVRREIITYQHARVPFGVSCSPYLLAATIRYHLEANMDIYCETAKTLNESFYVDNCVTSLEDINAVERFIKEASELMAKGKFELRGWMTNLKHEVKDSEIVSVLGVQWNRSDDELHCNLNFKTVPEKITKRDLLSITQQIFDPIGFLCPVTLVPKLVMQKAWLLNTGWDENISTDLELEYKGWISTIDYIRKCKIPRKLAEFPLRACKTTVHVFCDASKEAYAACVFLRAEYEGKVSVRLVVAKSRVSPIKRKLTLPRLELMGALIASRLFNEVVRSNILSACKDYKVYCWTDSAVVLAWLQRQETWKTFVSNRVKEICTNTNKNDWNHLPGISNPADLPSRGCDPKSLLKTSWWTGPQWLYLEKKDWPKSIVSFTGNDEENITSEQNVSVTVNVDTNTENFSNKLLYFSQYNKIVRLVATLLRLNPIVRNTYNATGNHIGFEEYKHAEETLIKLIQRENYTDVKNVDKKLTITNEDGFIKVKTRLQYSGEERDFTRPILLPGSHEIVRRMVQEKHKQMSHAGTQTLLATLRNSYWITGVRKLVKDVVSKCIICKRYKAKHYEAPEPPLPTDRIRAMAPFEVTGIDLAGPLFLNNNQKCWIVLFTCAVYRGVHLELTDSLSTNSFLMALRRFIARRGRPKIVYTDNGTNFVGAANLLREVDWREVEETTNCYKIHWKFSVPGAPWWGGWWERLIRVVKEMLRRILGRASINWIELTTILCDCEIVINSRPLTYVEMGDVKPLTPLSFLQSLPSGETHDLDQIDEKTTQIRYKYLQQLRQDFRQRFKSEYIALLISKGKDNKKEPEVGELVLVGTDKSRLQWPLGIIVETYIGKDGFKRAAKVHTASGDKVRPYQKLFPLELSAISQEWLDSAPLSRGQDSGSRDNITPIPLSSTRSGRTIKLPSRFFL